MRRRDLFAASASPNGGGHDRRIPGRGGELRRRSGQRPMTHQLQFKAHLRVERLPGEGVMLLSERGQTLLRGRLYELVAPLIDGRRVADEIVEQLKDHLSAAEVYHALRHLE